MCLIIYKPKAKTEVPQKYIDNAMCVNPDGFGIVFLDTGEMIKTSNYKYADTLLSAKRPYVAHFRYATQGKVNEDNMHPAPFAKGWLFSNGTVPNLGNKTKSDTRVVADYLTKVPRRYWGQLLSMTDTRFAIVTHDLKVMRYGEWHKKGGVFYSKDNCFTRRYATYGGGGYYGGCTSGYDYTYEDDEPFCGRSGWWDEEGRFFRYTDEDAAIRQTVQGSDDMLQFIKREDYPVENAVDLTAPKQATTVQKDEGTTTKPSVDDDLTLTVKEVESMMKEFHYSPALTLSEKELYDAIDSLELIQLNLPAGWELPEQLEMALDEYYAAADRMFEQKCAMAGVSEGGYDMDVGGEDAYRDWGRPDEFDEAEDDLRGYQIHDAYGRETPQLPAIGELVAVYGTLKRGHGNYYNHLADSEQAEFISAGRTDQQLRMEDRGIPYVYEGEHPDGHHIVVDVFRVLTFDAWEGLDSLEGCPWHYDRKLTDVTLDDGTSVKAWMYYAVHDAPKTTTTTWIDNYRMTPSRAWQWGTDEAEAEAEAELVEETNIIPPTSK